MWDEDDFEGLLEEEKSTESPAISDNASVFKFHASGRRYCHGQLATMELKSRHFEKDTKRAHVSLHRFSPAFKGVWEEVNGNKDVRKMNDHGGKRLFRYN
ncbi:predicted protein [Arabidopsis lyrata subsp. lyrata]|uniref:Predicted protein n=1 Tax=Arabidopsis lyrata subsp. lyrata TaxID=81972 RepID=D7MK31_ARALL|nr:predicted protein [Arabidopsis lyrata subsp. lyrata]